MTTLVRMSSVERDRERRQKGRGDRGRGEAEDEVRDRERLGHTEQRLDTSLMSTSGYSGYSSPVHSSEFSLRSSHSSSGDTDRCLDN